MKLTIDKNNFCCILKQGKSVCAIELQAQVHTFLMKYHFFFLKERVKNHGYLDLGI